MVRGNQADSGGGIYTVTGDPDAASRLLMRRSTVSGNVATSAGGGISLVGIDNDSEIEASTISGNDAARGGGIWTNPDQGDLTIVNSTIANNTAVAPDPPSAPANGGGLYTVELASGTGTVRTEFTTIAGNESLSGRTANLLSDLELQRENTIITDPIGGVNCSGATDSAGRNLDQGTSCDFDHGTDLENSDAALEPLAKNGGPTKTMALGPTSDAFSDGDCTPSFILPGFDLGVDQRGVARPQGLGCDIGAYEGGAF